MSARGMIKVPRIRFGRRARVLTLALAASAVLAQSALAVQINVTTTSDEFNTGPGCALREAISSAQTNTPIGGCNTGVGSDTVVLPEGKYTLTRPAPGENSNVSGDLDVINTDSLSIESAAGAKVTIDGNGTDRVLEHFGNGPLSISGITIQGGRVTGVNDGGGILNGNTGLITLDRITLIGNNAGNDGGAVANYAQAVITNTTMSGNSGSGQGGGYYGPGGSLATLNNVTIAGNTADKDSNGNGDGGGLAAMGSVTLVNSIIAANTDDSPTALNQVRDCLTGVLFVPRFSLIGEFDPTKCEIGVDPGNLKTNVDAKLGPLADNGGPLQTRALLADSPALNTGGAADPFKCAVTDERGIARPQGPGCDMGAFELVPTTPAPVLTVSPKPKSKKVKRGRTVKFTVKVKNTGTAAATKAKVCLKPRGPLKARGKKCVSLGTIAISQTKTAKMKVKVASKAAKKSYRLSFNATATGAKTATGKVTLKVR